MKKIISIALISAFASTISNAMTITNGTLINHHENIPADAKVTFKEVKLNLPNSALNFINKNAASLGGDSIKLHVKAYTSVDHVNVGDDIPVQGESYIFIMNNTNSKHAYTINTSICDVDQGVCYLSSDTISLDPQGTISSGRQPSAIYHAKEAGLGAYLVETTAQRDQQETIFSSEDYVFVSILDEKK